MTAVATLGLVVNLVTAVILARAGAEDLNTRSAYVHMLGDTLSSVAIVAGGAVLWATGWTWIDPALSLLVAGVILIWGVGLVRRSVSILLELAPRDADPAVVRGALLEGVPDLLDVHDLHVWEITSGYRCLTAHLVLSDRPVSETGPIQESVRRIARERFRVGHVTLQVETEAG
jgi:cobalt-zinc-cadmium efflux system protein